MLIEAPESRHQRVARQIRAAAEVTGVPFDYLLAQANTESRMDPNAASQRSSAMGLYQFTAGTWLEMVKKHGADHGLGNYADAITKGRDGKWNVADKELKAEILNLRKDPRISSLMAGEYASDNGKVLEAKLGRKASTHDLYLAHFLGRRRPQGIAGNGWRSADLRRRHPARSGQGQPGSVPPSRRRRGQIGGRFIRQRRKPLSPFHGQGSAGRQKPESPHH